MKGKVYQKQNGALVDITPDAVPFLRYEVCEIYYFLNPTLRRGFVQANGGLIANANTLYPAAFQFLQTTEGQAMCVSESQWQALSTAIYYTDASGNQEGWNGVGGVAKFVLDTANGTIRVPDLRGMYAEAAGLDSLAVGGVHGPGVPNIEGAIEPRIHASSSANLLSVGGAFRAARSYSANYANNGTAVNITDGAVLDASRSSGAYGAGGAQRVRPRAFGALACVYLGS